MSSLKYLDITSCQNITLESLVNSLYKKTTVEMLRMSNCFEVHVRGQFLVTVVKFLPSVKIVEASGCDTISLNQAQEILQTCALSEFSFSPEWGPSPCVMWERFLADYKYVQFDGVIKVYRN